MSIVRFQQTIAGETMCPPRSPFLLKTWGTSRFPTPLHAHESRIDI